jgi:putative FmdB family regulatory protein
MPIYEYECEKCGHRFEKIQKFSDPPLEVCEKCGGSVHKMQSAPAFQFKGTGWYVTDYAKSGKTGSDEKKAETEKPDAAKPASTASTTPTASTGEPKSGD